MAILIGNDRGSTLVPLLEREGLHVEVAPSPEQALERLQAMVAPGAPPGLDGHRLDLRLAAVQERARALQSEELKIISEALQHASGNKTAAARLLGISRYALQRRLRRFAKPAPPAGV